ncbi:MAG: translation initiation factor IF-2 [Candidatus Omnitrophica bacterium 4484_70.2]|nr:MAG: translation initiation factor IF-2 [Candidatus Omnitrophica bacterium 4484_70.2]
MDINIHRILTKYVDHGKTTLLDYIRKTSVAQKEAGKITQDIGATDMPISIIFEIAKDYLKPIKDKIRIPGLLFIDTPGHLAFTAMREKGGAIADLAVLIVDINEGLKPQTEESLEILKKFRTPFVVALTKIDKISGWRTYDKDFSKNWELQNEMARNEFNQKFYSIIGELSNYGFNAELFSQVKDFTKELAVVPCSGITGEGLPNLFAVLVGLSQKFLIEQLELSKKGRGVFLEVKKDDKLGVNADIILYDGQLKVGDRIFVSTQPPTEVRVRALLKPDTFQDIRVEKKFVSIDKVNAASGVKIIGKNIENVVAGANFEVIKSEKEKEELADKLREEEKEVEIENQKKGLILRAHNAGGLEALVNLFKDYPIKRAKIGPPTKEDLITLEDTPEENRVLICFNVNNPFDELAASRNIKVIKGNVIYRLFEEFEEWKEKLEKKKKEEREQRRKRIAKIRLLPGFVFRQSNPAVIGVEVVEGSLAEGSRLMNSDGKIVGEIMQIQKEGETVKEIKKEDKAAISVPKVTVGRQIKEGEILYTFITKEEYRELRNYEEINRELLEEIRNILDYL